MFEFKFNIISHGSFLYNFFVYLNQKSKQQETKVEEEDEDDDDDPLPMNTTVQKVEPQVQEIEQDHVQEKATQPKKSQQIALEHEEDDEDSEWDSEVQSFTGFKTLNQFLFASEKM